MEDLTTRLSPSSLQSVFFRYDTTHGHTPTILATTSTRPGVERSFIKMVLRTAGQNAIQSQVSAPLSGSPQIKSLRTGPSSQTQTEQFTGGNASSAGDQMWGTPRAWHGTHFPSSLQKLPPEFADLHLETQEMHLDQQHSEFSPES